MSLMNDKNRTASSIRDRLDAFKTINIVEKLSFNATLATPAPTSNSCNSRIFDFDPSQDIINQLLQCLESDLKKFEDFVEQYKCSSSSLTALQVPPQKPYNQYSLHEELEFWQYQTSQDPTLATSLPCFADKNDYANVIETILSNIVTLVTQSFSDPENPILDSNQGCITENSEYVTYFTMLFIDDSSDLDLDRFCYCQPNEEINCFCNPQQQGPSSTCISLQQAISDIVNSPIPAHLKQPTSPLTLEKVEGYNPMLAALYVGFVCSVLTAGLVGASIVLRDNFDVFTLTLPGMFEKTFQLTADIITSLFIASLLLENEMNGCQVWNLSDTAVQCALVSGLLYIYIVVVMAFVSSNRRLQHMSEEGGSTFRSFISYAAM